VKRISSGTVTVCVLAIVVGLVSAFVIKQVFTPKPQPVAEKPKVPTVPVVVAARNLVEHQVIRRGDVRIIQVPVQRKPEGSFRMTAVAENRIIKQALKAGQPLSEDMLYGIGETLPGLADRIPPGYRALPIHVDEQSVVAKMVNIGSRVDVALTVEGSHPELGELATKTLLHNVEVIGVEKPSSSRRSTSLNTTATITVAVTPADANRIINAEGFGTLDLTLCSPSNEVAVSIGDEDHKVTKKDLLGLPEIPAPPPAPKPFTIEKWEGGSVRILKISPEQVEEAQRSTTASKKFNAEVSAPAAPKAQPAATRATAASIHPEVFEPESLPVTTVDQN
jgi:pilus assembly protein CpaB